MKEIQLTRGYVTQVDDSDFDWLSQWNWYSSFAMYKGKVIGVRAGRMTSRRDGKKFIKMSRVIMGVSDKNICVDHIDGNPLNNQRSNLRVCSHAQNMRNCKPVIGSSKYKGVASAKVGWLAKIMLNRKTLYLGSFNTEIEAAIAYNEAAKIHHGEFARLNVIPQPQTA